MSSRTVQNMIVGVILALFAALFLWLFYSTFFFSEGFDHLTLRNVDDHYFQMILWNVEYNLTAANWRELFLHTECGYGNIYWTSLALLRWPLSAFDSIPLLIMFPRWISLGAYVLCFVFTYKIFRNLRYSNFHSALGLLLVASCSSMFIAAGIFHNHLIVAALCLASFYLLTDPAKNRETGASVLFGVAIGLKVTAILAGPVFLFLYARRRPTLKSAISNFAFLLGTAAFCYSPTLLLLLVGDTAYFLALKNVTVQMASTISTEGYGPWEIISLHLLPSYFHGIVVAAALVAALGLALKKKRFGPVLYFVLVLSVIATATVIPDHRGVSNYIMVLGFLFPVILLELSRSKNFAGAILMAGILLNLYLNRVVFTQNLFSNFNEYHDAKSISYRSRLEMLKQHEILKEGDKIVWDDSVGFPLGYPRNFRDTDTLYASRFYELAARDVFILSKSAPYWKKPCEELPHDNLSIDDCHILKKMMASQAPFIVAYEDEQIFISRQKKP